jgi:hypothetical protein
MARDYTASEVERMRRALSMSTGIGKTYQPGELQAEIEAALRKCMADGIEPGALEARAKAALSALFGAPPQVN